MHGTSIDALHLWIQGASEGKRRVIEAEENAAVKAEVDARGKEEGRSKECQKRALQRKLQLALFVVRS